ncbi:MAG: FKBP-type peptidyl-prolyl cis-trans isomerase [Chitinophagaceae bacterium]|nr:FKBP-type peptidyl-prolyl cis-trans isomerase [Chitinophagaceae bacterium]MCW5905883.1 FKBP-type peptidyl-prolyl cis-trans isomerase [Chitinophagaceae bacterium]
MKKFFAVIIILTSILISCTKNKEGCTPIAATDEKPAIIAFCTANNIQYTEHSSGIFYEIIDAGTGITPTINSRIFIYYHGTLLNGSQFDAQADPTQTGWYLNSLIDGWQKGIPLIKKGGRIKLIIPSALAYGCTGSGAIPANAPLYFDITLTDVIP